MKHRLCAVDVFDESFHATRKGKIFLLAGALVDQLDAYAIVEEGQFPQAPRKDVVVIIDIAEDRLAGEEMHFGATALGRARNGERRDRHAIAEFHLVDFAVTPDRQPEP